MKVILEKPDRSGCVSESSMTETLQKMGYRVNAYTYPPGTFFPPHDHPIDKMDAVVEGFFKITMNGQNIVLSPGEALKVPKGVLHSAEVIGDSSVRSLDGLFS